MAGVLEPAGDNREPGREKAQVEGTHLPPPLPLPLSPAETGWEGPPEPPLPCSSCQLLGVTEWDAGLSQRDSSSSSRQVPRSSTCSQPVRDMGHREGEGSREQVQEEETHMLPSLSPAKPGTPHSCSLQPHGWSGTGAVLGAPKAAGHRRGRSRVATASPHNTPTPDHPWKGLLGPMSLLPKN